MADEKADDVASRHGHEGTEPKRLRFRELSEMTSVGFSSTNAGPMLLPMVPITNSIVVKPSTNLRIRSTVADLCMFSESGRQVSIVNLWGSQ